MKYIDAEKLKKEIENLKIDFIKFHTGIDPELVKSYLGYRSYDNVLSLIDSLQQEQPEADLDREITHIWGKCAAEPKDQIACLHIESFIEIARHFYELGKNSK